VSLDLEFDSGQRAIAAAVAGFCSEHCDVETIRACKETFPRELWQGLAELGALGLATPDGGGGAIEVVAAVESLGHAVFPGPLVGSLLATQLLPDPARSEIAAGSLIVSAGVPPLMPWAPFAGVFLEISGERVFEARVAGEVERVEMLGGEPWGRVALERERELQPSGRGLLLAQIALSAQLSALGTRLVEDASSHAALRVQFGVPIGDFQAVAHPLADCSMQLAAASMLARAAAFHFDSGEHGEARLLAASAQLSACNASLQAAYVCHQVFGAIGITLEGPVFDISRRIRQLASQPPGTGAARSVVLEHYGLGPQASDAVGPPGGSSDDVWPVAGAASEDGGRAA
jgi:alkylation response protein AidB-like acyl-CoA dehydrogenase